jgi:hypothetical protein
VADGATVRRFDVNATYGASGGAKQVASVEDPGHVRVLSVDSGRLATFTVPGAIATAIDADGRVFVQTTQSIHEQTERGPSLVYQAAGANLHGFVTSGKRVWFGEGTKLGALEGHGIAVSAPGKVAGDASLLASPSGALWTLSEGTLSRFEIPATGDGGV